MSRAGRRRLAALPRDEHGASALVLALTLTTLLALVALGVDTTRGLLEKRRLQHAADQAALAGAMALSLAQPVAPAARGVAAINLGGRLSSFEAAHPPRSGAYAGDARAVEVVVRRQGRHLMAGFLGAATGRSAAARAVARVEQTSGCPASASGQPSAGLSLVDILPCLSGVPGQGAPALPSLPPGGGAPWAEGCTRNNLTVSGVLTLPPGAANLCGTTRVPAGATLMLQSGNHQLFGDIRVEPGGRLEVRGGSLVLWGTLRAGAGSTMALSASRSGDLAGIAAVSLLGGTTQLAGDGRHSVQGMLLLPFQGLEMGALAASSCVTLAFAALRVVRRADLAAGCNTSAARPERVRLVE